MYAYITMSHRTQIILSDDQYALLLEESGRSGLGLAELVRRAVTRCYGDVTPNERVLRLRETSGTWLGAEALDGESYVERLRQGMARRMATWE